MQLKTADVFWGWGAQEITEGWLQLSGGRPQRGKGKPVMEWRVKATGAEGWGRHAGQRRHNVVCDVQDEGTR